MSTDIEKATYDVPVSLGVADEVITDLRTRLGDLTCEKNSGYALVRAGIAEIRTIRVGVEKSRKELKQGALDWGRKVDQEARRVTDLLREIEDPLKARKQLVDDDREKRRLAKLEAERIEREEVERKERKERDRIESAKILKIRQEQQAAQDKVDADRKKLDEERAAAQKREVEAEQQLALSRREIEKGRAILDNKIRDIEAAETRKREEDQEAKNLAERKAAADRLVVERKPDVEILMDLVALLSAFEWPGLKTDWAIEIVDCARDDIIAITERIKKTIGSHEGTDGKGTLHVPSTGPVD